VENLEKVDWKFGKMDWKTEKSQGILFFHFGRHPVIG
jgi:hypothetical protein